MVTRLPVTQGQGQWMDLVWQTQTSLFTYLWTIALIEMRIHWHMQVPVNLRVTETGTYLCIHMTMHLCNVYRPIFGYINFCLRSFNTQNDDEMIRTGVHEIIHVLVSYLCLWIILYVTNYVNYQFSNLYTYALLVLHVHMMTI